MDEAPPEIVLRPAAITRADARTSWSIAWIIDNQGLKPLDIVAVHLPHGQFRSAPRRFDPPLSVAPAAAGRFDVSVACNEPPGPVTENAFVILSVLWSGAAWRIFVRLRVSVNSAGFPETVTERITTQRVGFSAEEEFDSYGR